MERGGNGESAEKEGKGMSALGGVEKMGREGEAGEGDVREERERGRGELGREGKGERKREMKREGRGEERIKERGDD